MEKLLELASMSADQVEIYAIKQKSDSVTFENAKLKDIDSSIQSGLSLRIIKDGKTGFAYTKNLHDREGLIRNAVDSLKGGVEGQLDFPYTKDIAEVDSYDSAIESLMNEKLYEECSRICEYLTGKTKGQINVNSEITTDDIRIINNQGTDIANKSSHYSLTPFVLYPGSYASIYRMFRRKKFEAVPNDFLDYILHTYNSSEKEVSLKSGKVKTLFLPETMYVLMWRLRFASNGKNIYVKESPLIDKIGDTIIDERVTIFDDPLNDNFPGARSFDDEGIPCRRLDVVRNGVLRNFYYDLFYAKKMNTQPTGHGFKSAMWGGETVSLKPTPSLQHLFIEPGNKSIGEIINSIDKGIIIPEAMGAHSGNIPNGDFSVGLSPGLYVENGEITGHIKDAMVTGNIYDLFNTVLEIEDTVHPSSGGTFPAILFDNVSVGTKTS